MNTSTFYAAVTGGKIWNKGARLRIYARGTNKVQDVYLDFEDGDVLKGAALKCFIRDCGQAKAWYVSQRRLAEENIGRPLFVRYLAAAAFAGAKGHNYDFTDADVEKVADLLDKHEDLNLISQSEEAMKALEAGAASIGG